MMWTGHLPPAVRAVLSISDVKDLERLAQIADTVMENIRPQVDISQVNRPDNMALLTQKIDQLQLEVAELRSRHNNRGRSPFQRRYRSRSRSKSYKDNRMCYYHKKFGQAATRCKDSRYCSFQKTQPEN